MSLTEQCQNHTTITQKNLGTIRLIKQKNQEFRKDPAPSSKLQNKISLASPQNTVTNTSQYITNICPHTRPSPKKETPDVISKSLSIFGKQDPFCFFHNQKQTIGKQPTKRTPISILRNSIRKFLKQTVSYCNSPIEHYITNLFERKIYKLHNRHLRKKLWKI